MRLTISCPQKHAIDDNALHSKPVPLRALQPVGELKAVHLQQVEERVSHHAGYAVVRLHQAAAEPLT